MPRCSPPREGCAGRGGAKPRRGPKDRSEAEPVAARPARRGHVRTLKAQRLTAASRSCGACPINKRESYAEEAARRYEGAEAGIAALFPFVFQRGESVLDIGAGSGRDAARLLHQGVDVQAVEPSSRLRRLALAAHPELQGRLLDGFLPGGLPPECQREYDGILLSAVIMHIPDGELFDAAFELRGRLAKGGKLLISMPMQRDDLRPGEQRDEAGRLMVIRSVAQVRLLFERLGFQLENDYKSADSLGRGFLWASLYFRASGATTRAIDRVESIINADRKVATYKLALVRALCDIAMTSWAVAKWEPGGGAVSVPLERDSRQARRRMGL